MKPKHWIILIIVLLLIFIVLGSFFLLKIIRDQNPNLSNTEKSVLFSEIKNSYVDIRDYGFFPSTLTIRAGERVIWKNLGSGNYTVDFYESNESSGIILSGENYTKVFVFEGTYNYTCNAGPRLIGKIIVNN